MMHSLDTVKTRQQGAPTTAKYFTMSSAYRSIFREEGLLRGLYGGITPAMLGSIPGTAIFFATYEFSKRNLTDMGVPETVTHLMAGLLGDLFASSIYVPSEVLKTRLQLQGRCKNPHFQSGYNYRGTLDAIRTIYRNEGRSALFHGYRATVVRDLPFSALTFAFYEEFKKQARKYAGGPDIGLGLEIMTGSLAGALGGAATTPLDVVKTRIQTQQPDKGPIHTSLPSSSSASSSSSSPTSGSAHHPTSTSSSSRSPTTFIHRQIRQISTSPNTSSPPPASYVLTTSSAFQGLKQIYAIEGIPGLFRGVGPRTAWTGAQSSIMFVLYETMLRQFAAYDSRPGSASGSSRHASPDSIRAS